MTPEKQRIKIAEACGWKIVSYAEDAKGNMSIPLWADPKPAAALFTSPPDYLHSLDAMHEAVMSLTVVQKYHYSQWLDEVTEPRGEPRYGTWSPIRLSHATASQRAEAFLKTIGKWEDE